MALDFNKYAMKGNEFLNRLAKNLGDEADRDRAARILRSVLHTLRKYLTLEESEQLLAQLPMAIKGVYVEGWQIHQAHARIKSLEDFAGNVLLEEGLIAWHDFKSVDEVMVGIRAVIETISSYVSHDEMEEAFGTLPKNLKEIFTAWMPS